MKAVILAGGRGKRINSITKGENKCLLRIRNKTILEYNVANISQIKEVEEIIIVVGYRYYDVIREMGHSYEGIKISYCIQREQKGLIHALEQAISTIGGEDILLILGDEYVVKNNYSKAIEDFYEKQYRCMIGVIEVADMNLVRKTYSIKFGENKVIEDIIEKPSKPFNNIMGTGNIILKGYCLDYIEETPINSIRNEKELVDFLKIILKKDEKLVTFKVGDHYVNINTKEDYYSLTNLLGIEEETYLGEVYELESVGK